MLRFSKHSYPFFSNLPRLCQVFRRFANEPQPVVYGWLIFGDPYFVENYCSATTIIF